MGAARTLLVLGRLVALTAATLIVALVAKQGYELFRYASFSESPTWGEVGILPFVYAPWTFVAGWVAWGVVRLDGNA